MISRLLCLQYLAIVILILPNKFYPQSEKSTSAQITLLDKSKIEVSDINIKYYWHYQSDWENYYNPELHKTSINNLIYNEIRSGVKIERNKQLKDILEINVNWGLRKGYKDLGEEETVINSINFIITLKDSTKCKIELPVDNSRGFPITKRHVPDLCFPSTILQSKRTEEIKNASFVTSIIVTGKASIDNIQGDFSGVLYEYKNPKYENSRPLIKHIVFN